MESLPSFLFSELNLPKIWTFCCRLVAKSCPTLCDPMTVAHQVPLSMRFSRPGYWNR